jgi:hypothetical protein
MGVFGGCSFFVFFFFLFLFYFLFFWRRENVSVMSVNGIFFWGGVLYLEFLLR